MHAIGCWRRLQRLRSRQRQTKNPAYGDNGFARCHPKKLPTLINAISLQGLVNRFLDLTRLGDGETGFFLIRESDSGRRTQFGNALRHCPLGKSNLNNAGHQFVRENVDESSELLDMKHRFIATRTSEAASVVECIERYDSLFASRAYCRELEHILQPSVLFAAGTNNMRGGWLCERKVSIIADVFSQACCWG